MAVVVIAVVVLMMIVIVCITIIITIIIVVSTAIKEGCTCDVRTGLFHAGQSGCVTCSTQQDAGGAGV